MLAITTVSHLGSLFLAKEKKAFFLIMVGFSLYVSYLNKPLLIFPFQISVLSKPCELCGTKTSSVYWLPFILEPTYVAQIMLNKVGVSVVSCARLLFGCICATLALKKCVV